ncbi:MAG: hypothetical protein IJ343_04420 [Clostridia bacterium]|nr:hypothetical protein [Clostridia bacterium]
MKTIQLTTDAMTWNDWEAIDLLSRASGANPFVYLGNGAALLLSPGQTDVDALLREAHKLVRMNLRATRPGVFVYAVKGTMRRMVRTIKDLCVVERAQGEAWRLLYQRGLNACRRGSFMAVVLPGESASGPVARTA